MRDIFDIIDNQKSVHINIEGEISTDSVLFDIEYINYLVSIILDNQKDVDFKTFDVKEYKDTEPITDRFGMYGVAYDNKIQAIEFNIDVVITNRLYNRFDESLIDFIDFYTKGSITYSNKKYMTHSFDPHEEYMSSRLRPVESSGVFVSALDYETTTLDYDWGIGSYPLPDRIYNHDADGDGAIFAAVFDSVERPVIGGRE